MKKTPVIGLGAGGHARVVMEMLESSGLYEVAGLLDQDRSLHGSVVGGVSVLGDDELLGDMSGRGIGHFFVGLGSTGRMSPRRELFDKAVSAGLSPVSVVHRSAVVSPSASIGDGATIMAGAVINAAAIIGANVIVNTGAVIEHDCSLEDHVHVATGACLAGAVKVGGMTHIGAGATVIQNVTIGEGAIVGAGAVVISDVPDRALVVGVPAGKRRDLP